MLRSLICTLSLCNLSLVVLLRYNLNIAAIVIVAAAVTSTNNISNKLHSWTNAHWRAHMYISFPI